MVDDECAERIRMLRDSASAVGNRADLERVRRQRFKRPGFDRILWRKMAELGWIGMRIPEDRGGAGLGMLEFCALAEELGGALIPEPLIAGVFAAQLLDEEPLAAMLGGGEIYLPAWQESPRILDGAPESTLSGDVVNGRKLFVSNAAGADGFVVTTRQGLALISARDEGVAIEEMPLQDGSYSCTLKIRNARGRPLRQPIGEALDHATLGIAAYLLGVIEAALARTLDYLVVRKQFEVAIGTFQTLQHAAVDMKLQALLTRAAVEEAATLIDANADGTKRLRAISRAKARASEAALFVTKQAIQLHGGVGYTDEHDIGLYLRKAMALAPAYGNAATHRERYLRLDGGAISRSSSNDARCVT
jgi:alkylation response protein AidB-like acyl-CoA dehydrogenase